MAEHSFGRMEITIFFDFLLILMKFLSVTKELNYLLRSNPPLCNFNPGTLKMVYSKVRAEREACREI